MNSGKLLAIVFAVLMVGSILVVPLGAADGSPPTEETDEEPFVASDADVNEDVSTSVQSADDSTDAEIDDAVSDRSGTVDVIVRLEEVDRLAVLQDADPVNVLQSHAERSQEPIVEYAEGTPDVEIENQYWLTNAVLVRTDADRIDELAAQPNVARITENAELSIPEPVEFDAEDDDPETTYGLDQIDAPAVWEEYGTMGEGTSVAVLDTGVAPDHPDIDIDEDNWAELDEDGEIVEDSEPHDTGYHGTHTSGTVTGGNASGEYIGVAPGAELMHGLVLPEGSGSIAQIIGGMEWAVEEDADVISMSLGAPGYHTALIDPVRNAQDAGVAVSASSGNDGHGTSGSPGNVYDSFAVGASDEDGNIAGFSSGEIVDTDDDWNFGAPSDWPESYVVPDVAAPGVGVRSAVPSGTFDDPDIVYGSADGTSMAAPHVSGALALALSASEDEHGPEEITSVFERSAWKPDGATFPDQQDSRYGHGIIDAKTAVDRVAASGGIEGTVTDADGNPVDDAEVSLDGTYPVETDANGEYVVRTAPGNYTLEVEAFGYHADSATVSVDESFETVDLELESTVEAAVVEDQPEAVQTGEFATATVEYVNAESVTIDLEGDYDEENLTLHVDGSETAFGESIEFDAPTDGETTVTVDTDQNVTGDFSLTYAFDGLGETDELTTGPTEVFDDMIEIGVIDAVLPTDEGDGFPEGLADQLDETLSAQYNVSIPNHEDAADRADEFDAFVVQKLEEENYAQVREFLDATAGSSTGVVFLEQYEPQASAIEQLSHATNNPEHTDGNNPFDMGFGPEIAPAQYEIVEQHPIFDGLGEPGDTIPILDTYYPVHTWFEGYQGGTTIAEVGTEQEMKGDGLAVDDFRRYVLASSLGHTWSSSYGSFEPEAKQVLANSVEYVTRVAPPVSLESDQDVHIAPGESTEVDLAVRDLEQLTVSLSEDSTASEEDLELTIDGKRADFDQALAYDELTTGSFTISTETDEDLAGSITLEISTVAGGQNVEGTTGPTAVYDPPIEVPHDVDSVQEAVDLVPNDARIEIDDGVYEEHVRVTTSGLEIVPAAGADPVIEAPADLEENETVHVTAPDVTFSGLTVDGAGEYDGVVVEDSDYATVTDLTVKNADHGIRTAGSDQLHVANNHVTDSTTGIELRHWYSHDVTNNVVEDVDTGIYVWENRNLEITDNVVRNASDVGIDVGSRMLDVDGNLVENSTTGVAIAGEETVVTNNTVTGADVGLYSDVYTYGYEIQDNEFAADVGLHFHGNTAGDVTHNVVNATNATLFDAPDLDDAPGDAWETPEDVHFRFNDVSASENVAVTENASSGFDARSNYLGENGTIDDAFEGSLWIDPFLTVSPDEADAGEETTQIGVGLELEAGETTAIGVPGRTDATINDVFPDDLEGVVYGFSADDQSWTQRTANEPVNALEPLLVVPEDDATATLSFETDDPSTPGQRTLTEGWNFVSSPVYGDLESAYETGTTDFTLASAPFEAPGRQIGPVGELGDSPVAVDNATDQSPNVSPFEGTFLFVTEDGTQPAHLTTDPTMESLYTSLGLDVEVVESPGDPGGVAPGSLDGATQVYGAAEFGAESDRLTSLVLRTLERDLATLESDDERTDVLNESAEDLVEGAPDDHRETVAASTADAVSIIGEHGDSWTDDQFASERNASVSGAVAG